MERLPAGYEDMEEYHSLIDSTLSTCSSDATIEASTLSAAEATLPPLEETPLDGAVHRDVAHRRTVEGSMQAVVPVAVRESRVGTKRSGLFFVGDMELPAGQMLFLTHPTVMVHAAHVGGGRHEEQTKSSAVCDYCFRGPGATVEHGDNAEGGDGNGNGNGERFGRGRPAQRCTGCFVLAFCSESCHRKAWKQFHKYECAHLRSMRACDPISLTLLRVLVLDEAGVLPRNVLEAMLALTEPQVLRDDLSMQRHIQNCVANLHDKVPCTKRSKAFCRDLLRRIIGNQSYTARADGSARVLCLDVALANLNHSCDPNAFVFVEGRQARVRSARRIEPGEEITVDLVDLHLDVISRNNNLKLYAADIGYVCPCKECVLEMKILSESVPEDAQERTRRMVNEAQAVPRAMQLMMDITEEVWEDKRRALVWQLAELADDTTPSCRGMDPEHDKPKIWMRMAVASVSFVAGDLGTALRYALRSFFFQNHRATPDTVADLRVLANILVAVAQLPATDKQYKRIFGARRKSTFDNFPEPLPFRVFASGCLTLYQQAAVMVFGPKLPFVRSVLHWGRDKRTLCHPVVAGTSEYDYVFDHTQQELVHWCRGGKTDVYAPLRPPTVAQIQQMDELMEALDDKYGHKQDRGKGPMQQYDATPTVTPRAQRRLYVSEDEGYQGDSDTASGSKGRELRKMDGNRTATAAHNEGEKGEENRWTPSRDGTVSVAG